MAEKKEDPPKFETTRADRMKWVADSPVEVFLRHLNRWVAAKITTIFTDIEGEWLVVNVSNKVLFELNRYDEILRRVKSAEELAEEKAQKQKMELEQQKREEEAKIAADKAKKEKLEARQRLFREKQAAQLKKKIHKNGLKAKDHSRYKLPDAPDASGKKKSKEKKEKKDKKKKKKKKRRKKKKKHKVPPPETGGAAPPPPSAPVPPPPMAPGSGGPVPPPPQAPGAPPSSKSKKDKKKSKKRGRKGSAAVPPPPAAPGTVIAPPPMAPGSSGAAVPPPPIAPGAGPSINDLMDGPSATSKSKDNDSSEDLSGSDFETDSDFSGSDSFSESDFEDDDEDDGGNESDLSIPDEDLAALMGQGSGMSKAKIDDGFDSGDDMSTDYYTESEEEDSSGNSSDDNSDKMGDLQGDASGASDSEEDEQIAAERREDPSLIVVDIERGGSSLVNGRYMYKGLARKHPLWEMTTNPKAKIWLKYDNLWVIEVDSKDYYLSYTNRPLPPSSGWEKVDDGINPAPGVILHRIKQETIEKDVDREAADDVYIPMEYSTHEFDVSRQLGFTLKIEDNFICVDAVSDGQGQEAGLESGDLFCSIDGKDVSMLGSTKEVMLFLKAAIQRHKKSDDKMIEIIFGRKREMFPIVMVGRAGTKGLDGKYSVHGRAGDCFKFVRNDDPDFSIQRIFYDDDENEAVWVIRKNIVSKPKMIDIGSEMKSKADEDGNSQKKKSTEDDVFAKVSGLSMDSGDSDRIMKPVEIQAIFDKIGMNKAMSDKIFDVIEKFGENKITKGTFIAWQAECTIEKLRILLKKQSIRMGMKKSKSPTGKKMPRTPRKKKKKGGDDESDSSSDSDDSQVSESSSDSSSDNEDDSSDNESTGSVREKKHRDFYCGLTDATEKFPPSFGWEAIQPNGEWPAPGLTIYQIPLASQNLQTPVILDAKPAPKSVTIHFKCDEPLKPRVCPHMDHWFVAEGYNLTNKSANDFAIKCQESPVVFNGLTNGNDYQFIVKSCCEVAVKQSGRSPIVTPLELPSMPKFTNITGTPTSLTFSFACKRMNHPEVQAEVVLISKPLMACPKGFYTTPEGYIILPSEEKSVKIPNLSTGQDYSVRLRAKNTVASMECESEIATPAKPPRKCTIRKVIPGNREILIDVACKGWRNKLVKAWFEVSIEPKQPTLADLHTMLYKDKKKKKKDAETDGSEIQRRVAAMRRVNSMTRAAFASELKQMDLGLSPRSGHKGASDDKKSAENDDENDEEVPLYKRPTRYTQLPIILSPLVNGEDYVVTVRVRNYTKSYLSKPSKSVMPKGVPPKPRILSIEARDRHARMAFACDDYSTLEYRAAYEFISLPATSKVKTRRWDMKFRGLKNGTPYRFKCRGVNKEGKGPWSDVSDEAIPRVLPRIPWEVRAVPGNGEVSLYWVADDLSSREVDGWYEVYTKPPSYTMILKRQQCTFRSLENGTPYTFRVYATNSVGRSRPKEATVKPKKSIKPMLYNRMKKENAKAISESRREHFKRQKEREARERKRAGKGNVMGALAMFDKGGKKDHDSRTKKKKKETKKVQSTKKKGADEDEKESGSKKKKSSKKDKKKKKKEKKDMSGFAAAIGKQQSKEAKADAKAKKKAQMQKEKEALLGMRRRDSVLDLKRVHKLGSVYRAGPRPGGAGRFGAGGRYGK